ncbi:MAG: hypothetical protein J6C93_07825 [Clostridia bacterium]|nr:hypothetical protein [Clostridia bacterium]
MKKTKRLSTIALTLVFLFCGIALFGCSAEKYQVAQEEYDRAFGEEALSNVTFCVSPFWRHDNGKEYYYYVNGGFAVIRYHNDLQYFGMLYWLEEGEENCYLYGNELLERYTEADAYWRKSDVSLIEEINASRLPNAGFISDRKKPFDELNYDGRKKCYTYEFQDESTVYSYYFEEKKLIKFEITSSVNKNKNATWVFSDYGTTVIPIEIEEFE